MGFFDKLKGLKSKKTVTTGMKRALELHGQVIKYVTEREDGNDNVVGRGGSISVRDNTLLLFSSEKILLRANIAELEASYLLSGDGVVLNAPNLEEGGRQRSYIAYFVYHRK